MRQSQLFTKTRREAPKDEISKNAQLLIRAGFISKEIAGVYSYLPLGLLVLKKIENIIREEMNAIGGQEILMTALQNKELWERTGRWDDKKVDIWFKTKIKNGGESGLAITHEEPLTNIMTRYISSWRDLPVYVYQFQTKFRNETRVKSGIMRGREFLMKDLYSFSRTEKERIEFYEQIKKAYKNIFKRAGIGPITYVTFASGGIFSEFSEEFQTISEAGEDTIYLDEKSGIAVNKEIFSEDILKRLKLDSKNIIQKKSIEVGNLFNLGIKFSQSLGLMYIDQNKEKKPVVMGSYGIGLGRLMGTIVEVFSDEKGIIWPQSVSPFRAHLIQIENSSKVAKEAEKLYKDLQKNNIEVLYDERKEVTPGEKFAEADLIGIPCRIVISEKTLEKDSFEIKKRNEKKIDLLKTNRLISFLK